MDFEQQGKCVPCLTSLHILQQVTVADSAVMRH